MVADYHLLVHADDAIVHLAHAYAAHILIVINGADEHLGRRIGIPFRRRNVVHNGLEERFHAVSRLSCVQGSHACLGGSVYKGAVQLGIIGIQFQEQFQYFLHHLVRACFRAVNFVDADDDGKFQFQGLAQHEFRLGHGTLKGIHYQDDPVYHLQHPFHLAAEVRVARGVNDVDLGTLVHDGSIFGQDGDTAFPFDIIGVHDALCHCLAFPEYAALSEQPVHQGCLAVIHMGDNSNISYIFSFLIHTCFYAFLER